MIHLLIARAMLNADPADYPAVLQELSLAEKSAPADADVLLCAATHTLARMSMQVVK